MLNVIAPLANIPNTNERNRQWVGTDNCVPVGLTIAEAHEWGINRWRQISADATYFVFGVELSPAMEQARINNQAWHYHLQLFFCFKNARTRQGILRHVPGVHIEKARGEPVRASNYCKKGEQSKDEWETHHETGQTFGFNAQVYETGTLPLSRREASAAGGAATAEKWTHAWELAKSGDIESIDPQIRIQSYSTLKKIQQDFIIMPENLDDVCGIWIYGPTGTGKSHKAREMAGERLFVKQPNQWWCGFRSEDHDWVLLDDFSKTDHKWMGYSLKIWADKYAFPAAVKFGGQNLRPKHFIVTSNWAPNEIWDTPQELEPIMRRFKIFKMEVRGLLVPVHEWNDGMGRMAQYAAGFHPPPPPTPVLIMPQPALRRQSSTASDGSLPGIDLSFL